MTAAFPWTSVGVATGYRGTPRVSKARATAHGASTANATVVATASAAVLSVANSVVPTMAIHGHPRQSSDTRQLPRKSTAIAIAISRAFRGHPLQLNCNVNRRQFPWNHGSCNGNPRKFPRQATGCYDDHGKARQVESLSMPYWQV